MKLIKTLIDIIALMQHHLLYGATADFNSKES